MTSDFEFFGNIRFVSTDAVELVSGEGGIGMRQRKTSQWRG